MLSHSTNFAKTGRNAIFTTSSVTGDFDEVLLDLLSKFDDIGKSEGLAGLIDLCDGSTLFVDLYYVDLTCTDGGEDDMRHSYTRIFSFSEFKSTINVDNPNFTIQDLAVAIARVIKGYLDKDPNSYKSPLHKPGFRMARIRMTLNFGETESSLKSV